MTKFTLLSRLQKVISTSDGRRHLARTWKFTIGQAVRAATGLQVSEVLEELGSVIATLAPKRVDFNVKMVTESEFKSLATGGKTKGHHLVYPFLDLDAETVSHILEFGIGTNDPSRGSSMGAKGTPGASLRMWLKLFPKARVFGADVDRRILLTEGRICSFFVDQTDKSSLESLRDELASVSGFDLIVDDGLHTPESNLRTLSIFWPKLKEGGWYVVEDLDPAWAPFWDMVALNLAGENYFITKEIPEQGVSQIFLAMKKNK